MAESRTFEASLKLLAKLDGSFQRSIKQAEGMMKSLEKQAQMEKGFSRMESNSKRSFGRVSEHGKSAAKEIGESFKRVMETTGGVFLGEKLREAFDKAGDMAKEFISSSFEVRATREVLQNQQQAAFRSLDTKPGYSLNSKEMDTWIRNQEGQTTPRTYREQMEATNLLATTGKFKSTSSLEHMVSMLADTSKDSESYALAARAISRMFAGGKLDFRHVGEFAADTGYNLSDPLMQVTGAKTQADLEKMIKKAGGAKSLEWLQKAMEILTGKGGAAYEHAAQQLIGLNGIMSKWTGHLEDLKESFGKNVLEPFLQPISDELGTFLTSGSLTHAFDSFESKFSEIGKTFASTLADLTKGDKLKTLEAMGTSFENFFKRVTGWGGTRNTGAGKGVRKTPAMQYADRIERFEIAITNSMNFITTNWETVKNSMIALAGIWAGSKVLTGAAAIKAAIAEIAGFKGAPGTLGSIPGVVAGTVLGAEIIGGINGLNYLKTTAGKQEYYDQEHARLHPWMDQTWKGSNNKSWQEYGEHLFPNAPHKSIYNLGDGGTGSSKIGSGVLQSKFSDLTSASSRVAAVHDLLAGAGERSTHALGDFAVAVGRAVAQLNSVKAPSTLGIPADIRKSNAY